MNTLLCGRFLEGVEIHDDHVDRLDSVLGDGGAVRRIFAAMKNSAVNLRMQGFNATVEHFGEAGEVGDVFDVDAGIAQQLGGAAGGDELDAHLGELAGEIGYAGLISDTENCALDFSGHCGLGSGSGRRILSQEECSCSTPTTHHGDTEARRTSS